VSQSGKKMSTQATVYMWIIGLGGLSNFLLRIFIAQDPIPQQWISFLGLAMVFCLGAVFNVSVGKGELNVGYMALFTVLVSYGPLPTMWLMVPAHLLLVVLGKRSLFVSLFNFGQLSFSAIWAYFIFARLGGMLSSPGGDINWLAFIFCTLAYDILNFCLVSGVLSLRDNTSFFREFLTAFWHQRKNTFLLYHSLAVTTSVLFFYEDVAAIVILSIVTVSLRYAFELPQKLKREKEAALQDGLTEVYNYRYLSEWKENCGQKMINSKEPFAFLFLDIDNLKKINDTWGHTAGDDVIRYVAKTLRESCRKSDCIIRYGGDEFLIILPGSKRKTAAKIALRLYNILEEDGEDIPEFSVSMGLGSFPEDARDIDELFDKVDQASYRGKRTDAHTVYHVEGKALSADRW